MEIPTLTMLLAMINKRSENAATRAETAAQLAQNYGYQITISDGVLTIGEESEE